jgi:hypothetical protein
MTHNQTVHILIDKKHSRMMFSLTDGLTDTDRCVIISKLMERLSVKKKQTEQASVQDREI